MITRRGLFGILAGAVAAPIVVRSGLLMPVKRLVLPREPLFYSENTTYTRYSGYDVLDITPADVTAAAEYDVRQVAIRIAIGQRPLLRQLVAQHG